MWSPELSSYCWQLQSHTNCHSCVLPNITCECKVKQALRLYWFKYIFFRAMIFEMWAKMMLQINAFQFFFFFLLAIAFADRSSSTEQGNVQSVISGATLVPCKLKLCCRKKTNKYCILWLNTIISYFIISTCLWKASSCCHAYIWTCVCECKCA